MLFALFWRSLWSLLFAVVLPICHAGSVLMVGCWNPGLAVIESTQLDHLGLVLGLVGIRIDSEDLVLLSCAFSKAASEACVCHS